MFIGAQNPFATCEGRDQHQQCRFRQMKIGQHGAHDAEVETGIDEDVGFPILRHNATLDGLSGGEFEGANGCCSHCNHAPPGLPSSLDAFCGVLGDLVPLAMELVLLYDFLAHGLKRAEADVQRDLGGFGSRAGGCGRELPS